MLNVGKPILRGKITAEFGAEEQGKAISALDVGANFSALAGTAMCNGLLAVVIKMEEGEALDVERAVCLGGKMSLASGAPFFVCSVLIALAWFLISKFKHLEPGAGEKDGVGEEGGGEGVMELKIVTPTNSKGHGEDR